MASSNGTLVVVVAALVGLTGGALLPLPAYRFAEPWRPDDERSSPVRNRCVRCGQSLATGVPGWLRPGGRCPHCAARLGPPTWLLAALGAAGAAGLAARL